MQTNFSHNIGFKVAAYSTFVLTNGDYIRLEKSDCDGEEVELFSVLIQIVEAGL